MTNPMRTSPLSQQLESQATRLALVQEMNTVVEARNEAGSATALTLCDASALPRFGVCGPRAARWLTDQAVAVPRTVLGTQALPPDGLCLRTGQAEFIVEDGPEGTAAADLARALGSGLDGVYPVLRQDAQILLRGEQACDVLAQVCGVNFRAPGDRLVFTRLAGVSCAVLPPGARPWFRIWVDATHAVYLWQTLLQIVRELDGGVSGLASFFPRCSHRSTSPAHAKEQTK